MSGRHQIRALFDEETITVYQAYSDEIGKAAVATGRLSASPAFNIGRTTWIKPSWNWMMYRCGYSYKDDRQTTVLALKIKHEHFITLLREARLAEGNQARAEKAKIVVQWDPERGPRLERYNYRSIQIGITSTLVPKFVDDWVAEIEDVTERAREMKKMIDADPTVHLQGLRDFGLMPHEAVYEVPEDIANCLNIERNINVPGS